MKSALYVEYKGHKTETKNIENMFKEMWKEKGRRIKDIHTVEFYLKPEETACYYVVNESEETGKIAL